MDPSFFLVSCLVGLLARTTAVEKMGAGLQARAGGATIQPPLPQAAGYVIVVVGPYQFAARGGSKEWQ